MKINIKHIAKLANLNLSKEEEERFTKQLQETLAYIDQLNEIKTEGVEITSQVTGLENVLDKDEVLPSLTQKEALGNARNTHNGLFIVDAILDEQ